MGNEKLIEYWNEEILIKKSNLKYHSDSINKLNKKIDSLNKQLKESERKIEYHKNMVNEQNGTIAIIKGRIEMLT